MTSVKAALTVILKANDVIVAEIEDAGLWQQILTAIHSGSSSLLGKVDAQYSSGKTTLEKADQPNVEPTPEPRSAPIDALALQLSISKEQILGACSPTTDSPFLRLDAHCWEVMKKQLPKRGKAAIAPIVAAATLLVLWFQKANIGSPTQSQALAVLDTINITDPNASRSIRNASWLQVRPGQVVLNPAEISKAVKLATCFCTKDWTSWKESTSS
jgi:hypothetical protein